MHCTRLPCCDARLYTWVPTAVDPTKETATMSGWVQIASTERFPPWMMLSTPGGIPASRASSASSMGVSGSCSEGLRTNVLPQTMAMGNIHSGIMAGKLNGEIPAHTPMGWWMLYVSTPPATFSANSPICRLPMEQACSTTSRPRKYISLGIRQRLALLGAQGPCDAAHVLAHQRLQLQHDSHPGGQRRVLPGREGLLGRGHGRVDFRVGGEGDLGEHLLGGRIDHIVPFGRLGFDEAAVDEQFSPWKWGLPLPQGWSS